MHGRGNRPIKIQGSALARRGCRPLPAGLFDEGSRRSSHENAAGENGSARRPGPGPGPGRDHRAGNEYFTINFARFHCSNCEHFRPAGAKPQGATINYDGVMPQSIYYAAHRMSPQMIPTCLHGRALCVSFVHVPEVSVCARPDSGGSSMHARKRAACAPGSASACTSTNWQR